MSDHAIGKEQHREKLLPVLVSMVAMYVVIVSSAYFIGNLIYQIP